MHQAINAIKIDIVSHRPCPDGSFQFQKASAPLSELEKESYCLLFDSKSSIIESTHQRKGDKTNWKTISIRLEDSIYEELGAMLDEMGQTKTNFFMKRLPELMLRERSIPFIIKAPLPATHKTIRWPLFKTRRIQKNNSEIIDCDRERGITDEKYGIID